MINLYHYLADNFEDIFTSAVGDVCLNFSSQMSYIDITSMMSYVGLNSSQLRILFRLVRYKLVAKMFTRI